jgi:hypothetical protein
VPYAGSSQGTRKPRASISAGKYARVSKNTMSRALGIQAGQKVLSIGKTYNSSRCSNLALAGYCAEIVTIDIELFLKDQRPPSVALSPLESNFCL